jgi:putative ABC transport system substrate-binding protein
MVGVRETTFAKELVDLRPDAILCDTTPTTAALARETRTIPIVFTGVADPVVSGFVQNLAHPGGNLTGIMTQSPAIGGRWVGLLKEIAPRTVRAAMLFNPATAPTPQIYIHLIETVATSLAIQTSAAPVHAKDEIEGVIAALARDPGGGLVVMPDVFNVTNRDLVIALAARYGVPAIYFTPGYFAQSGGLICYGTDFTEQFRQAAGYVDRILKGEKSAGARSDDPTDAARYRRRGDRVRMPTSVVGTTRDSGNVCCLVPVEGEGDISERWCNDLRR